MKRSISALWLTAILALSASGALAGEAKGTLVHPKATVTLKYAYLVKGPDAIDNKKIIRRIILSGTDLSAKLQACAAMSCSDSDLTEGMTVDLDGGPRLNYWMVLNGGMIQHSGSKEAAVLKVSADDAKHLAGKLSFDDSAMGGPKVDVDFDANFVKAFTKAR
ncbi:MAG TPA: hypothetical protein VJR29_02240 [bacterium]|nr:hypothetical protein [bacterium]